jgi:Tol biopolymer transport system component
MPGLPGFRRFAQGLIPIALALAGCDDKAPSDIDRTLPEVEITFPTDGAIVSGVGLFVEVNATDDGEFSEINRVEMLVNGTDFSVDDSAPFSLFIPTIADLEGAIFNVVVQAFDEAGNSAQDAITVTSNVRTVFPLTSDPGDDMNPSWSPDGTRIAFQSDRTGEQFDIYAMNADGGNETPLTTNLNDDRNPAWSPMLQHIAFDSNRAGEEDIWKVLVVSGEPSAEALTFANLQDVEPAWSPDGTALAFSSSRGLGNEFNIWRIPASGGTAVQLTAFPDIDESPAYSPSGDLLAFVSTLNFTTRHVYLKHFSDDSVVPLTGDVGFEEFDPAWSPQDRAGVFARNAGSHNTIWTLVLGRLIPTQATFGTGVVGDAGPAWSPDGTTLAFHSDRNGNLDIFVVK